MRIVYGILPELGLNYFQAGRSQLCWIPADEAIPAMHFDWVHQRPVFGPQYNNFFPGFLETYFLSRPIGWNIGVLLLEVARQDSTCLYPKTTWRPSDLPCTSSLQVIIEDVQIFIENIWSSSGKYQVMVESFRWNRRAKVIWGVPFWILWRRSDRLWTIAAWFKVLGTPSKVVDMTNQIKSSPSC